MKSNYVTKYDIIANVDGIIYYPESISSLPEGTLVAKVKVIEKNGVEIARDKYVKKEDWMTVEEYENTFE